MSQLTPADYTAAHPTDLDEDTLQDVIDACEAELARWGGSFVRTGEPPVVTPVTETFRLADATTLRLLGLPDLGEDITITETVNGDASDLLVTDDWTLDGDVLTRVNARWGDLVTVAYTPQDRAALWRVVIAAMVQQDLNRQPGLVSTTVGSWSETYSQGGTADYETTRYSIMSRWRESTGLD